MFESCRAHHLTRVSSTPNTGFERSPYHNINPAAFLPPTAGSTANPLAQIGMESPTRYFMRPGINDWTLSVQKSFTISENVRLQVRADAFNAFNHTQFSDYNRTANFASLTNPTISNLPRLENGRWINPTGFGAVTSVRDPRIMQLMARIQF